MGVGRRLLAVFIYPGADWHDLAQGMPGGLLSFGAKTATFTLVIHFEQPCARSCRSAPVSAILYECDITMPRLYSSGFQQVVRGPPVVPEGVTGGPQLNDGELVTDWTLMGL